MKRCIPLLAVFLSMVLLFGGCAPKEPSNDPASSEPIVSPALLDGMTVKEICPSWEGTLILTEDGNLYFDGDSERMADLKAYAKAVPNKDGLYLVELPAKIDSITPRCAVGDDGTLYVFSLETWLLSNQKSALATITLEEPVKKVSCGWDDILVLTEGGALYSIGYDTLHGRLWEDDRKWEKYFRVPVSVAVPEPIVDMVLTNYTAFAVGESGKLYLAYRATLNHPDGIDYPAFLTDSYPLPETAQVFRPVGMEGVVEIDLRTHTIVDPETKQSVTSDEVFVRKADGTVWRWGADHAVDQAFFAESVWHTDRKSPEVAFEALEICDAPIVSMGMCSHSNRGTVDPAYFIDEAGKVYFLSSRGVEKSDGGKYRLTAEETLLPCEIDATPIMAVRDGIVLRQGEKFIYWGYDGDKVLISESDKVFPEFLEITGVKFAP